MSLGFGSNGGTSMGMGGGGPKVVSMPVKNQAVLDALVAITGQNFGFEPKLWKNWAAAQKKPADTLDARRND
jgi:hypothetical protein